MEEYFKKYKEAIVGIDQTFHSPYGEKKIVYADWIASGRLYRPIEEKITNQFGPFIGNTHTETSETGTFMTKAYHLAQKKIKEHVNAGPNDVIITAGSGMTTVINKFQRILGFRAMHKIDKLKILPKEDRPVVFITHMEHHSNHTSWLETIADVVQLSPNKDLLVDPEQLKIEIVKYTDRKMKIGSFTACSNVTGIKTPYHEMAKIMHENGGFYIDHLHFNLAVKLLNDKFGIQLRGGCACDGTYGHFLLDVSHDQSDQITRRINFGDLSQKPGWIRLSLHPTMTNDELYFITDAIRQVQKHHLIWGKDYTYNNKTNEFRHFNEPSDKTELINSWFNLE